MPVLKLSSEPPVVNLDNLELFLDNDALFVEYFNAFLGLPSFALRLNYNSAAGAFDMVGGGCWACRAVRAMNRGENPTPFLRESRRNSNEDDSLGARLDKLQGLVWIKVHRLPAFLQSRYYSKYRLAKLLAQVPACTSGLYLHVDPDYRPWAPRCSLEDSEADCKDTINDEDAQFDRFVKSMCVCLGQTNPTQTKQWYAWAKQAETTTTTPSDKEPNPPSQSASYGTLFKQKGFDVYMTKPPSRKKKVPPRETVKITDYGGKARRHPSPCLHSPVTCMGVNTEPLNTMATLDDDTVYVDEDPSGFLAVYGRGIADKAAMAEFGEFLRNTSGEVKWSLWLDADQTRFIQNVHKMGLYMAKLQTKYLHSSSPLRLSTEMEQKLKLQRIRDWRPHRLQEAQSLLVQPLLQYWLLRFLRSREEGAPLISYEGSDTSVESLGRPTSASSLLFDSTDVTTARPQSCIPRLRSSTDAARRIYGGSRARTDNTKKSSRSKSARLAQKHSSDPLADQLDSESNIAAAPSSKGKKGEEEQKRLQAKKKQEELKMKKDLEKRFPVTKVRPRKSPSSKRPKSSPSSESDLKSFCLSAIRPPTAPSHTGRTTPSRKCDHEEKAKGKVSKSKPDHPKTAWAPQEEPGVDPEQEEVTQVEQTLVHDKRAGNFFEEFCEASGNKIWVNAVDFWRDLQDYRRLFNTESRQDYNIQRKARRLYSRYIVAGASRSILCPVDISHDVGCSLSAEAHSQDTFSAVEDHALLVLKEAWLAMRSQEADLLIGPLKVPH